MYNREAINILLWKAEMPCLNVWGVSQASQLCDRCHMSPELCTTTSNTVNIVKKLRYSTSIRIFQHGREVFSFLVTSIRVFQRSGEGESLPIMSIRVFQHGREVESLPVMSIHSFRCGREGFSLPVAC